MATVYSPYTKKECIDIVAEYFGITKKKAKEYVEHDANFGMKYAPYDKIDGYVGRTIAVMKAGLRKEARSSFYND